jgi:hypothetical protein
MHLHVTRSIFRAIDIHQDDWSRRSSGSFLTVNSGALADAGSVKLLDIGADPIL